MAIDLLTHCLSLFYGEISGRKDISIETESDCIELY